MKKLPINEMFLSFQGEGLYSGLPAYFVRTQGCPVRCSWCDSASTWHPDYVPQEIEHLSPVEIANKAKESGAPFCVITGGEPTIYDLTDLTENISIQGLFCHLETSGAYPIKGRFRCITVSPKRAKLPLPENIERATELKLIIESTEDIVFWSKFLFPILNRVGARQPTIWLHPEWSQHKNPDVLKAIVEVVKAGRGTFRAGWQLHKNYAADSFDPGTRPDVPLGGKRIVEVD